MKVLDSINSSMKSLMAHAIIQAVEHEMAEDNHRRHFIACPFTWARMWGHINTNFKEMIESGDIHVFPVNRGTWPFILIYDRANKILFTIMSKERLKALKKECSKKLNHYLDIILNRYNYDIPAQQYELNLFDENEPKYSKDEIDELLIKLMPEIKDEITRHVLLCFDRHEEVVLSVTAMVLSPIDFSSSESEDWTQYARHALSIDIQTETTTSQHQNKAASDIKVRLKKPADKQKEQD